MSSIFVLSDKDDEDVLFGDSGSDGAGRLRSDRCEMTSAGVVARGDGGTERCRCDKVGLFLLEGREKPSPDGNVDDPNNTMNIDMYK